jgi:SAM-dependent methyltransferase
MMPEFYIQEGDITYKFFHYGLGILQPCQKIFLKKLKRYRIQFFGNRKKLTVLDIGCGDGTFLLELCKRGLDVWGIDLDKKSIEAARRLGLKNVYALSLADFYKFIPNVKFDIITMFDVLEHQDSPKDFLLIIKNLLKPDGLVVGSVPNRDGTFIYFYRGKIDKTDLPPHHFLRFSKDSLEKILNINGFQLKLIMDKILEEIIINIETLITGQKGNRLKIKIRKYTSSTKNLNLMKIIKFFRQIIFFPIAFIVNLFVRGNHIYFEAIPQNNEK